MGRPAGDATREKGRLTIGAVVLRSIGEQVEELDTHTQLARSGSSEGIHRSRVAARRLRSALATWAFLFEEGSTAAFVDDLRWVALELGRVRDAEVTRDRVAQLLPDDDVVRWAAVLAELEAARSRAVAIAAAALDSPRRAALVNEGRALIAHPALTPRADALASTVAPKVLARELRRVRRFVAATEERAEERTEERTEEGRPRDPARAAVALHEARKAAKRLRYAAEGVVGVGPDEADVRRLAKRVGRVQDALGLHQDAVVARETLQGLIRRPSTTAEEAFAFGRLDAMEQARAEEAERAFRKAWRRVH